MVFRKEYPRLANFLGCWFPDADLEGATDGEVVATFVQVSSRREVEACVAEGERLLKCAEFPYREVAKEANRHFGDEEDGRRWFTGIMGLLKEGIAP